MIRHGEPDFPGGEKMCLGHTDLPLSPLGKLQACCLARALEKESLSAVYCSRLIRSRETAAFLSPAPIVRTGLEEMYAGEWDGLTFSQIRERFSELFRQRGEDPSLEIPGSESRRDGQQRFVRAVETIMAETSGDVAVVAHSTVNQAFFAHVTGTDLNGATSRRAPYCSYAVYGRDETGFRLLGADVAPLPPLDEALCRALRRAVELPAGICAHCDAVAERAAAIAGELHRAGVTMDIPLLTRSALLHDLARPFPHHDALAAQWLRALGYEREAALIARHHEPFSGTVDEAAVLTAADQTVREDRVVSLAERFAESRKKCLTPEAWEAHARREAAAQNMKETVNRLCGKEILP